MYPPAIVWDTCFEMFPPGLWTQASLAQAKAYSDAAQLSMVDALEHQLSMNDTTQTRGTLPLCLRKKSRGGKWSGFEGPSSSSINSSR
jgi:hypothetical protein